MGDLLVQAGRNVVMNDFATIQNLGSGELNIVTDNQFPTSPLFGSGGLITTMGSTIAIAGGPLRVFTAQQSQNTITMLNMMPFMEGTEFLDTNQERWFVYFPDSFGGIPFIVFYKNSQLTSSVINSFDIAISEAFRNWEVYDYFIYMKAPLTVLYKDKSHRRNVLTSFTVIPDRTTEDLRNSYRNYHTLKLENDFLP